MTYGSIDLVFVINLTQRPIHGIAKHRWKDMLKAPANKDKAISPIGLCPRESRYERRSQRRTEQKYASTYGHGAWPRADVTPADDTQPNRV